MPRRNPPWFAVVGAAAAGSAVAGGIFYLLMTVWFRSSAEAGWDWTRALGPTIGLVVVWFVIGLLTGRRSSGKTGPSGPR